MTELPDHRGTGLPARSGAGRGGAWAAFCLLAALGWSAPDARAAPRADPACRPDPVGQDRLAGLGIRGELILASGARARLSGLRWPDDPAVEAQARAWLLRFRDVPLALTGRGGEDRWGRRPVDAIAGEAEPVDLAGGLIAAGLAHADAGEDDALCRPALRALENGARSARLGVWVGEVTEAGDGPALAALAGRFAVVQGRILHVGERTSRTYLDFARRGESGLSVTVQKRTWRTLVERGFSAATLRGRLVRVRGTVETGRSPWIDLSGADGIEFVEGERAPRR